MRVSSVAPTQCLLFCIISPLVMGETVVSQYHSKPSRKLKSAAPKSKSKMCQKHKDSTCFTMKDFMNNTFVGHDENNVWYNVTLGDGGNFSEFSSVYDDEHSLVGVFNFIEGNNAFYTGGSHCNSSGMNHSGSIQLMENKTLDVWDYIFEEEHDCVNNLIILVPKLCSEEKCLTPRNAIVTTSTKSTKLSKKSKATKSSKENSNCTAPSRRKSSKSSKSTKASKCVGPNSKGLTISISLVLELVIGLISSLIM